jgi:hypothetical protein
MWNDWYERNHPNSAKTRQLGEKNSQFGTMWITNSESGESKKIKKGDLIPDGWVKGRKQVKKKVISW